MAQETTRTDREDLTCDICGEQFGSVTDLNAHKRSHMDPSERMDEDDKDIRRDIGAPGLPTSPIS